jgi:hypothetical protein
MGFLVDFLGPAVPGAPIIVAGLVVLTTGWLAIRRTQDAVVGLGRVLESCRER